MKRIFHCSLMLLALGSMISLTGVASAQQRAPSSNKVGGERLKQLFDKLAKSDWANDPDADEIRKLLKRVKEGKPLSPDQFATLFDKIKVTLPGQAPSKHTKNNEQVRRVFRPAVQQANKSTVVVLKAGKQAAMGMVIDGQGHILTKASELKVKKQFSGKLACKLADGKPRSATLVGVADDHDLALLKIDPQGLEPIRWHKAEHPAIGSWLATTGLGEDPLAVGVVSVAPRKIGDGGGFLGVMLGQSDAGPTVEKIVPKSAADEAGMQAGDVVIKIGDERMKTREQMVETVKQYKPGEVIMVTVVRDGEETQVRVTLGRRDMSVLRAGRLHSMNLMGGPISKRRTNFPNALQHDTVLKPEQCGGPIVDLDGNVVGINIARAGRVMSYAIPADTVLTLLPALKSGKLAPKPEHIAGEAKKPAANAIKPELEAVLQEIRKAEAELRNSQDKLRKAREALEKVGEPKQ
jgi:serine protease Do